MKYKNYAWAGLIVLIIIAAYFLWGRSRSELHTYRNERLGFSLLIPERVAPDQKVQVEETGEWVSIGAGLGNQFTGWNIHVASVPSENDVLTFVRQQPGWTTCDIESVDAVAGKDYQEVTLKRTTPEGGCFTNYIYTIFYSPDLHRIAAWMMGQAPDFWKPGFEGSYDNDMRASFEFLKG